MLDNNENSKDILRQNVRTIFSRINSRERELKQKLDRLAKENSELKQTIKSSTLSSITMMSKQQPSRASSDIMSESTDNEPCNVGATTSIEVAIGLSSTVQSPLLSQPPSITTSTSTTAANMSASTAARRLHDSTTLDHDDDDDAIYVILDEK